MKRVPWIPVLCLAGLLAAAPASRAQRRPYIGFAYPAGGQQGTTFEVRLGGQDLTDVHAALVTGEGVTAKVTKYERRLSFQDRTLLMEQLEELKKSLPEPPAKPELKPPTASKPAGKPTPKVTPPPPAPTPSETPAVEEPDPRTVELIAAIEKRLAEFVGQPAVQSIANLAFLEVTVAADAPPGERELRLITPQGVSNPVPFHIGQVPEYRRKAMLTSTFQVLGKEELAKRKRPPEEIEQTVTLPCTVNGQVASGEVNLYRFTARKDQRLVFPVAARRLVPYIADAVPGWFQPVLRLCDSHGNEVAYRDDFRFSPDPVIFYQVPKDGEYVLAIYDSIYRGREDFVYRISMGELPFVTHLFPLGGRAGAIPDITIKGWNLAGAELTPPAAEAGPGRYALTARKGRLVSNAVPFAVNTLPELLEAEPNDGRPAAQAVTLPVIINGHIDRQDDRDVFEFSGRAGETVVAEVIARRLGSPTDSWLELTDADGAVLAFNDDSEDPGSGLNTHHADSCFSAELPADGTYRVRLGETARNGGEEYTYRLRLGPPRPGFELRVVPSSLALRSKSATRFTVYAIRHDGFDQPIKLGLKDPPEGFSAPLVSLPPDKDSVAFSVKTTLVDTNLEPVELQIEGRATIAGGEIASLAVPAEDRMQAFLWRHLVPAEDLQVLVFDPAFKPPPKRPLPVKLSLK